MKNTSWLNHLWQKGKPRDLICPNTSTLLTRVYHIDDLPELKLSSSPHILGQIADAMDRHKQHLGYLESLSGKPITQALMDVDASIDCFRYFAGFKDKIHGRFLGGKAWVERVPRGLVSCITSFNYPLLLASWKLAPALVAGNSVLLKPSEKTPLSTLYLAHLFETETDIKPGTLHVVLGDGALGSKMIQHPLVKFVSFTGSTSVGKSIGRICGERLIPSVLELGGKNSIIIHKDADIEKALAAVLDGAFSNQGQNCCQSSLLYLHQDIYNEFMDELLKRTRNLKIGPSTDPTTEIGPLISKDQVDSILGALQHVDVLTGGKKWGNQGFFMEPTIISHASTHPIHSKELFGPVLSVYKYSDISNVISQVDDLPFALVSSIFTKNVDVANQYKQLKTGLVWINHYNDIPPWLPFGGSKLSGMGTELGLESIHSFTSTKSIFEKID